MTRKYKKDGYALVDIDIFGENQRGETTATGVATVVLPTADLDSPVFIDGSALSLDLPRIR